MKSKTRTVLLAAGLAVGLLAVAPPPSQACDFFRRLFGGSRRPAPLVEPAAAPRFYLGNEYRTEAYYPSYGCSSSVELGTQAPPAPPAEQGPEKTFQDEGERSSQKPAAPAEKQGAEPAPSKKESAPAPSGNDANAPAKGAGPNESGTANQAKWQPHRRGAARELLSQRATRNTAPRPAAHPYVLGSPGWMPVDDAAAKRLAVK